MPSFISLPFVLFFSVFFLLYWRVLDRRLILQNLLILIGSYLFYAWWDWRFLFLLIGNSALNFFFGGFKWGRHERGSTGIFYLGWVWFQGLGSLFFFKYYNFFVQSLVSAAVPLGISFYTFRTRRYLLISGDVRLAPRRIGLFFFPTWLFRALSRDRSTGPER